MMAAIRYIGAEAVMVTFTPRGHANEQLPALVAAVMKEADVIFTLPTMSPNHTDAVQDALAEGARVLGLGAATLFVGDVKYRLMPTSVGELEQLAGLTTRVTEAFRGGQRVRLTTRKGTDLRLEVGQLQAHALTGICDKPGDWQILPCGHIGVGVTPGTAEGTIVVDASITPVYRPVSEPVVLSVEGGAVTAADGGSDAQEWWAHAQAFSDRTALNIAEVGLGTNPKARLSGTPHEDERISGAAHIGIGNNTAFGGQIKAPWHVDANVLEATVEIDGERILVDGVYQI
jgi:leucyl aminopeptidase (aminopeptidase T)